MRRYEGFVIVGGKPVRVSGHKNNMGYGHIWLPRWEWRKRFTMELGDWVIDEIINPDVSLIEQTDCAHSALGEYIAECGSKISPESYLLLWNKYPNIENLVRGGFSLLLADVISECEGYAQSYAHKALDKDEFAEIINVKAAKPQDMLGCEKDELRIARSYALTVFDFYKWVKAEKGPRLTTASLDKAKGFNIGRLKELLSGQWGRFRAPVVRTINYLEKQRSVCGSLAGPAYLGDYWDMLCSVYRTVPAELAFPRDLKIAHDDIMLRVKEKENKALSRKIRARAAKLEVLTYSSEALGLMIRPAHSHSEIIKEGKMLHHCVGTYAKSHADGKTTILFIRHIDEPERPFFTLEYREGKVNQNRGDHNCSRTDEVIAFEAEWLNYISKLKELNI